MKLSLRANFTDPSAFGPTQSQVGDAISESYLRDVTGCILVHGYHSSAEGAASSYSTIAQAMPELKMIELYWPGGALALGFPIDVHRATEAGWRLRDILNGCMDASALDVQTHSLGARVAMEALKWAGLKIRHLILTAPAVENDCLTGEFKDVIENVETLNVFCSSGDPVLKKTYPLGAFGRQALGLYGPIGPREMWVPKLRVWDCSGVVSSHGGYRDCPAFYAAWRTILDETAKAGVTVL